MNTENKSKNFITYTPNYTGLNKTNTDSNYSDFRCLEPSANYTEEPWFRISNTCPCNPNLSNPSGRGFVACPYGVQFPEPEQLEISNIKPTMPVEKVPIGSLAPKILEYPILAVPQFVPRSLAKIGYTWRSAN